MQDLEPPPAVAMPITGTLSEIPARNAARWPQRAMYSLRTPDGWSEVTARQFHEQVRAVARGIVARGIEVGEPVAILSPTRYEWTVLDFALWSAGAFAVPIYDSSSAEQIEWILADSGARTVITDTPEAAERVLGAPSTRPRSGSWRRACSTSWPARGRPWPTRCSAPAPRR